MTLEKQKFSLKKLNQLDISFFKMLKKEDKENIQRDRVELTIMAGANVNAQDENQNTPLHLAAEIGNMEISKLLIKFGANSKTLNKSGKTPAQVAFNNGHYKLSDEIKKLHYEEELVPYKMYK